MAGKFRGRTKWDPLLIIYQILTIQLLGYASLSLLIFFATSFSEYSPTTAFIFDHSMLKIDATKRVILAHMANALVGAYLLTIFVERSKACLDFSLTYFAIHFMLVWYNSGIPNTFTWYLVNILTTCVMCMVGEFLCRREEMKSIPILASV